MCPVKEFHFFLLHFYVFMCLKKLHVKGRKCPVEGARVVSSGIHSLSPQRMVSNIGQFLVSPPVIKRNILEMIV